MDKKHNLIWIDLEMTGLTPEQDRILEIATIVTDSKLNIIEEGPVFAIKQSQERLDAMDKWNTHQHNKSGLIKRVQEEGVSEAYAEKETLKFLKKHVEKKASPMCGNSICQDRRFLYLYMSELEQFFHYRHLDVSTLKELVKRWAPKVAKGFEKESQHTALQDIKDSISEMLYYQKNFIRSELS